MSRPSFLICSSASTRRSLSSSACRRSVSASSIARASLPRSAPASAPSAAPGAREVVSGDTSSTRVVGAGVDSGVAGAAARLPSRYSFQAEFWLCASAIAAPASSAPISSRVGIRRIAPAFNALTFLMANACGFASRIASIMRWTLMDLSGRNRAAIDQSVSDDRTGP